MSKLLYQSEFAPVTPKTEYAPAQLRRELALAQERAVPLRPTAV